MQIGESVLQFHLSATANSFDAVLRRSLRRVMAGGTGRAEGRPISPRERLPLLSLPSSLRFPPQPRPGSGNAMPLIKPKLYHAMTLEDVRELVRKVREDGLQIQRHYKRLEQEYSDWEDRVVYVEKVISQMEDDSGISREEIYAPSSVLDDILDFAPQASTVEDEISFE